MEPSGSPGKRAVHHYDRAEVSPQGHSHGSKFIGPGLADTVHASEKFDKAGLLAAHLAALHDAYMLERGLLPGTSLPDSEAPPIPPVHAESPWKDFKLLSLAEMKVGKTHRKHALEGRLCAKSLKVTSVVNVLEEDSGLATKLILTNALPMRASMAQAQNCYPEGSRVTVRDPYLTRFPDGVVGVLVERPHDIAFLSRPDITGANGTPVYRAVGPEEYDDDRYAQSTSREHEDFSRKVHLFEEMKQMNQDNTHSLHSKSHGHPSALLSSKSSPSQDGPKGRSSPSKDERKEVPVSDATDASIAPEATLPDTKDELTQSVAKGNLCPPADNVPSVSVEERVSTETGPATAEEVLEGKDLDSSSSGEVPTEKELLVDKPSLDATKIEEAVSGEPDKSGKAECTEAEELSEIQVEQEWIKVDMSGKEEELLSSGSQSSKEIDTVSAGVTESTSKELGDSSLENCGLAGEGAANETQPKFAEVAPETKVPLIRKQFQRSDSLLAVHEDEDSRARARARANSTEAVEPARSEKPGHEERQSSEKQEVEVNHPSEFVETHSANDLRVLGNLMFAEENYKGATDLYTRSIRLAENEEKRQGKLCCKSEIILGYSNRAEAYIRMQEFGLALADAKKALSRDPTHLKSLFRKGRALLGLSQYEQALTTLQEAAPRAPLDRDLQAALHESSTGVQQACHGHYDLAHYYLKGKQMGESPFCVDYIGPVIVTDVGRGRGRGLILTKDVEAGELLLVSNPMAFLPLPEDEQAHNEISQALVTGKVQEGFFKVIEAGHGHNKGLEKLSTLYDGETVLPTPSVNHIDAESATSERLDAARIRHIIRLNAINGDATMGWKNLPGSGDQAQKVEHWGLWWLPSFINHSCLPSSSPMLVGKALFVFASRDLRAGDEVTRAYFDIFQPLDQRKELSTKGWGFICFCPRCKLEDALHSSLSKVTEHYMKLMELASKSKAEFGSDEKLKETQTSAGLKLFHKLETKLKDFKLNAAENNWVRSSFLHYIDLISGEHELHTHLESIVDALVTVCPGSETTLHMAVVAKDSARRTFGKKSAQFKAANQRAVNVCRFTCGKQKASVLQSIVDKNDYQS